MAQQTVRETHIATELGDIVLLAVQENGEIIGSVKQAGLSGNMAKALADKVILGDEVRPQGSYSSGTMYVPNVLLGQALRVNPV